MAVGFPLKTTYANGDVYSASDVNDTNGTVNLLTSSTLSVAGGKNSIINGGFDIWQRGTSVTLATNSYSTDRWFSIYNVNSTVSRQTTGVPVGSQYCARMTYTGAGAIAFQATALESPMVASIAGKTVTFSVRLRRNATFSTTLTLSIEKNATANTSTGGTWSNVQTLLVSNASLPTGTTSADWYLASVTATIPNDGTANGVRVSVNEGATGSSGAYWEMAQAQLEVGSTVTSFSRAGGTIQGELAACQRYYWRSGNIGTAYSVYGQGICFSSTLTSALIVMPVTLRTFPTSVDYSNLQFSDTTNVFVPTNISINASKSNYGVVVLDGGGLTGLTQFRVYELRNNNNAAGYLGISAEL